MKTAPGFFCKYCRTVAVIEGEEFSQLGECLVGQVVQLCDNKVQMDTEIECPQCGMRVPVTLSFVVKITSMQNSTCKTEVHDGPASGETRMPKGYIQRTVSEYVESVGKGKRFTQRDIPGLEALGPQDIDLATGHLYKFCRKRWIKKVGRRGHLVMYEKVTV